MISRIARRAQSGRPGDTVAGTIHPIHSPRGELPMSANRRPVAVVVGATSKWQSGGRNTKLAHGKALDDSDIAVGMRWGVGGAIGQKFAREGLFVVLSTRNAVNGAGQEEAILREWGQTTGGRDDTRL